MQEVELRIINELCKCCVILDRTTKDMNAFTGLSFEHNLHPSYLQSYNTLYKYGA